MHQQKADKPILVKNLSFIGCLLICINFYVGPCKSRLWLVECQSVLLTVYFAFILVKHSLRQNIVLPFFFPESNIFIDTLTVPVRICVITLLYLIFKCFCFGSFLAQKWQMCAFGWENKVPFEVTRLLAFHKYTGISRKRLNVFVFMLVGNKLVFSKNTWKKVRILPLILEFLNRLTCLVKSQWFKSDFG